MAGLGVGLGSNARVTVMALGDSNLAGYGATPGGATHNCGARYALWQLAAANGINLQFVGNQTLPGADANTRQIFHLSISGSTIAGITTTLQAAPQYFPEIVILMGGAIDVISLASAATMASQMDAQILTAWNLGQRPGANRTKLIIACQIADVFDGSNTAAEHALVIAYNALLPPIVAAHVAAGRNVKLVNLYNALGPAPGPNFNAGSVPHMNDAGYLLAGSAFFGTPGSGLVCDYGRN